MEELSKIYTNPEDFIYAEETMANEVTMRYVASGIFLQEIIKIQWMSLIFMTSFLAHSYLTF